MPLLLVALVGTAGCGGEPPDEQPLPRLGRFGIFRDLVLADRPTSAGGPFFMDRFETTQGDWAGYLSETRSPIEPRWRSLWGGDEPSPRGRDQPMARVSLAEAREYARWRFCRLPRLDEWIHAATDGGRYPYPWGNPERTTWANTVDLGLGRPTLVGTFESGRLGDGPYDLVGNVAEWTETPTPRWFDEEDDVLGFRSAVRRLERASGLGGLGRPRPPFPAWWLISARPLAVPRMVVGWSFNERTERPRPPGLSWVDLPGWQRLPDEWSDAVGLRLVADPRTLLEALARFPGPVPDDAGTYLRRFLADPDHRRVLSRAWSRRAAMPTDGPLVAILVAEIGS